MSAFSRLSIRLLSEKAEAVEQSASEAATDEHANNARLTPRGRQRTMGNNSRSRALIRDRGPIDGRRRNTCTTILANSIAAPAPASWATILVQPSSVAAFATARHFK